jgi:hypothetical protein
MVEQTLYLLVSIFLPLLSPHNSIRADSLASTVVEITRVFHLLVFKNLKFCVLPKKSIKM